MVDILNLALPYFGLIFVSFACGKAKSLPESGLVWMNFFLLYVSLPALLFAIMSTTPFSELNNPPVLVATTRSTVAAFTLALVVGKVLGGLTLREATLAGLSGGYGNIGYMRPGLALAVLGAKASAPTALIFCCDSIFLFTIVPLSRFRETRVVYDVLAEVLPEFLKGLALDANLTSDRGDCSEGLFFTAIPALVAFAYHQSRFLEEWTEDHARSLSWTTRNRLSVTAMMSSHLSERCRSRRRKVVLALVVFLGILLIDALLSMYLETHSVV